MNRLEQQFLNYQVLGAGEIPKEAKEYAGLHVDDDDPHRIDVLWGYLRNIKKPGTKTLEFDLLFKIVETVMTIPHSNAGEERIHTYQVSCLAM